MQNSSSVSNLALLHRIPSITPTTFGLHLHTCQRIRRLQALEKFASAVKRFATARGKPQLYHETITHAYFFLIRERMARTKPGSWDDFVARNTDLLQWKGGLLSRYYDASTLESNLAREVFLFPDKTR